MPTICRVSSGPSATDVGLSAITSITVAEDTVYQRAIQEIYTDIPMTVACDVEGGRDAGDGGRGAGLLRGLDRVEHVDGRAADDAGIVGVVPAFREAGQRTPGLAPADRDHGAFHGLDVLILLDLLAAGALARHGISNA